MTNGIKLTVFSVSDVEKATALFSVLFDTKPYVAEPYYVGFKFDETEVGLDPNGHASGQTAPLSYVDVADIDKALTALKEKGASVAQEPTDVGNGMKIAKVKDADGNIIGLRQN